MKVLLFLPLLVVGLLMSVSLINVLFRDLKVFTWPKTDCSVVWSAIEENPEGSVDEAYRFKVVYRYEVNGRTFFGDRYSPKYRGSSQGWPRISSPSFLRAPGRPATTTAEPPPP